jgi:hypothetical protein
MLVVNTSSAKDLRDPPLEQVHFLLFEDPDAWYWNYGASIDYVASDGRKNSLLIAYADDGKYYVQHNENLEAVWVIVSDRKELGEEAVHFDEELYVSVGLVCDASTVWRAVEWFAKNNGTRCPSLDWIRSTELPPAARY